MQGRGHWWSAHLETMVWKKFSSILGKSVTSTQDQSTCLHLFLFRYPVLLPNRTTWNLSPELTL